MYIEGFKTLAAKTNHFRFNRDELSQTLPCGKNVLSHSNPGIDLTQDAFAGDEQEHVVFYPRPQA
jgi:hypothetical protein